MNAVAIETKEEALAPRLAACPRGKAVFRSLPGSPTREYFLYVPEGADEGSPVLVLVHGITRNAAEHVFRFRAAADRSGTILVAPLFAEEAYGQYQQVVDRRSGTRADLALFDILDAVSAELGASVDCIRLFGFSGGAQFAHRFTMLYPERVAAVAAAAAGWYTLPDPKLRYPMGIGSSPIPTRSFDPECFLAVPRHVLVGDCDVLRDESFRATPKLDRRQGATRLARAQTWFGAMKRESERRGATPASTLTLLQGAGHSFTETTERHGLAEIVFQRFGLLPRS